MIANLVLFVLIAVIGGLGSSWYMIEKGSRLTTRVSGPWVSWSAAARAEADPYTRAHFMRRGMLPVSASLVESHQAFTDNDGQALYSSCEYLVEGEEPQAVFWSLAVFDEAGRIIPNPADRYAYNSATVNRAPGGKLDVVLARSARPGNWLPTGGAGRISLMLTLEDTAGGAPKGTQGARPPLPGIRRLACR